MSRRAPLASSCALALLCVSCTAQAQIWRRQRDKAPPVAIWRRVRPLNLTAPIPVPAAPSRVTAQVSAPPYGLVALSGLGMWFGYRFAGRFRDSREFAERLMWYGFGAYLVWYFGTDVSLFCLVCGVPCGYVVGRKFGRVRSSPVVDAGKSSEALGKDEHGD